MQKNPTVLIILDGFGHSDDEEFNAIAKANTPNWDSLRKEYPNTLINASESYVGLPSGQMGNSEVGHLNIGAGRIIHQDIERINLSIESEEFYSNPILNEKFKLTKINESIVKSKRKALKVLPVFKKVDTCAAEFKSFTPYMYSTYQRNFSF